MTWAARNFVLFTTELFVFRQRDEDIGRWSVGGDCAGWFYVRLLLVDGIRPYADPMMEDWGWTCTVAANDLRVRVNMWAYQPVEHCWILGVEVEKGYFRRPPAGEAQRAKALVSEALDSILAHDPRMFRREWFAENPFELDIKDF